MKALLKNRKDPWKEQITWYIFVDRIDWIRETHARKSQKKLKWLKEVTSHQMLLAWWIYNLFWNPQNLKEVLRHLTYFWSFKRTSSEDYIGRYYCIWSRQQLASSIAAFQNHMISSRRLVRQFAFISVLPKILYKTRVKRNLTYLAKRA